MAANSPQSSLVPLRRPRRRRARQSHESWPQICLRQWVVSCPVGGGNQFGGVSGAGEPIERSAARSRHLFGRFMGQSHKSPFDGPVAQWFGTWLVSVLLEECEPEVAARREGQ